MVKVQWYPGHMEKARRQMVERLQVVDMLIEVRDARIPLASENPMLKQMAKDKPKVIILTKIDQADPEETKKWVTYLSRDNTRCLALDLMHDNKCGKKIVQESLALMKPKRDKQMSRGIKPRSIRAMAAGIPNVGKSTLINRVTGKNQLKVADKAGVTRSLVWIHADKDLDLLDTPGVLWPKFDDEKTGSLLAALGSINDDILDKKMIAMDTIRTIQELYPGLLEEKYDCEPCNPNQMLKQIAKVRHFIKSEGELDTKRAAETFLTDLRHGKLGNLTLEQVNDEEE